MYCHKCNKPIPTKRCSHSVKGKRKCCDEKKKCCGQGKCCMCDRPKLPFPKKIWQEPKKNFVHFHQPNYVKDCCLLPKNRSYDGSGNNTRHPSWGKSNTALLRVSGYDYENGIDSPAVRGSSNPNPRSLSNAICQCPNQNCEEDNKFSTFVWAWGQFLDHELDLTTQDNQEPFNITTPPDDQYPGYIIPFNRSKHIIGTGTSIENPRQQPNEISTFIDASNVYGSSSSRAFELRRLDGSGKLKTTIGENGEILLPFNVNGIPNDSPAGQPPQDFYLAGDQRSNENVLLTSMHTLFVREHNRLCDILVEENPSLSGKDEDIFQYARKIVGALEQQITYGEFLPIITGKCWSNYNGYSENCNPGITIEFSTFAYRLGHTMVNKFLLTQNGLLQLRDAFFNPSYVKKNGVDGLLFGASQQNMEKMDAKITEEIRTFLFGPPENNMLHDLAALNIQRGRDHGIPSYNDVRVAFGLPRYSSFSQISDDTNVVQTLQQLYANDINSIDPWIGALCENHIENAKVGSLLYTILTDQFQRLQKGDSYWFENDPHLSKIWVKRIKDTKLSDILKRNTSVQTWSPDVFRFSY